MYTFHDLFPQLKQSLLNFQKHFIKYGKDMRSLYMWPNRKQKHKEKK